MQRIKSENTLPEIMVRKFLYAMGYRYRIHVASLPGKPDIIFRGRRKAIFINGCFWHTHSDPNCKFAHTPKSRLDYWVPKLKKNIERDAANIKKLHGAGWNVLVIWECEIENLTALSKSLIDFLI